MILTIDELIETLEKIKEKFGNAPIAIDDADTGYHMKIKEVRQSNKVKGRILIDPAGYRKDDCLPD